MKKGLLFHPWCVSCEPQARSQYKKRKAGIDYKDRKNHAVPVCLMVEDAEVMRYKNIELPDALKEIEMKDFHFNVHMDGKITFEIHYEQGALPDVFPEPRARKARTAKAEVQAEEATQEPTGEPAEDEPEGESEPAASGDTPAEESEAPGTMEIALNLSGIRRKELVTAVGGLTGAKPEYKAAPSFAYEIGGYTVDKNGTLTGESNPALIAALAEQGFAAAE